MTDEQPNDSTLAAAQVRLAEAGALMAEAASKLRDAIEKGTVPPKATAQLVASLDDLAAQMRPEPPYDAA